MCDVMMNVVKGATNTLIVCWAGKLYHVFFKFDHTQSIPYFCWDDA